MDRRAEAFVVSVSSKEASWNAFLLQNIQEAFPEVKYSFVTSRSLVGIYAAMFARDEHTGRINNISTTIAACGMMGMVGNKGAAGIRVKIDTEFVCFVSSHLAPHTNNVARRNQDYADLSKRLLFPASPPISKGSTTTMSEELIKSWDDKYTPSTIWDCGLLIWAGDLNYRLSLPSPNAKALALSGLYDDMVNADQLMMEMSTKRAFEDFTEGIITFAPSYKYDIGSDSFDSRPDGRAPAYTDRVLYRKGDRLKPVIYTSVLELRHSDHKPVACLFNAQCKSIAPAEFDSSLAETLRQVDSFENEAMPITVVSTNVIEFGEMVYHRAALRSFELLNTGQVVACFKFVSRPGRTEVCAPWLHIQPRYGVILPGSSIEIRIYSSLDVNSASQMNNELLTPEDILIIHIDGGRDHFVF